MVCDPKLNLSFGWCYPSLYGGWGRGEKPRRPYTCRQATRQNPDLKKRTPKIKQLQFAHIFAKLPRLGQKITKWPLRFSSQAATCY